MCVMLLHLLTREPSLFFIQIVSFRRRTEDAPSRTPPTAVLPAAAAVENYFFRLLNVHIPDGNLLLIPAAAAASSQF